MSDESKIPEDLWLVKTPDGVWPCTPESALDVLAGLAYGGALPGTSAEKWFFNGEYWERYDDQPRWESPAADRD